MATMTPIENLETAHPFSSLPIQPDIYEGILRFMAKVGFDKNQPIRYWRDAFNTKGRNVVTDGHTRLRVARELGLTEVPTVGHYYDNVDDAFDDTVRQQALRRNLSGTALVAYVLEVLPVLDEDSHRGIGSRNDLHGRSAAQLADLLNVSKPTIERARASRRAGS